MSIAVCVRPRHLNDLALTISQCTRRPLFLKSDAFRVDTSTLHFRLHSPVYFFATGQPFPYSGIGDSRSLIGVFVLDGLIIKMLWSRIKNHLLYIHFNFFCTKTSRPFRLMMTPIDGVVRPSVSNQFTRWIDSVDWNALTRRYSLQGVGAVRSFAAPLQHVRVSIVFLRLGSLLQVISWHLEHVCASSVAAASTSSTLALQINADSTQRSRMGGPFYLLVKIASSCTSLD